MADPGGVVRINTTEQVVAGVPPFHAKPIMCPRCGYDQGGIVRSWASQCPMEGRCSECGLQFHWQDLFARSFHPWLFEYTCRQQPLSGLITTLRRALQPKRFWHEVRITDPVRYVPAATVAFVCLLIAASAVFFWGSGMYYERWLASQRLINPGTGLAWWLWALQDSPRWMPSLISSHLAGPLVAIMVMPLLFLMLPMTLRRAQVRPGHILRIWCYSLSGAVYLCVFWAVVDLLAAASGFVELHMAIRPAIPIFSGLGRLTGLLPMQLIDTAFFTLIAIAWASAWWYCAMRYYLKLPRPGLMIPLLGTTAFLCGTIAYAVPLFWF